MSALPNPHRPRRIPGQDPRKIQLPPSAQDSAQDPTLAVRAGPRRIVS
jgi:hypothetical protein